MSNQVDEEIDFGTLDQIFPEGGSQNADTELDFGDEELEAPAAPTGVDRDSVYKYLQENPSEFEQITDIGAKVFKKESAPPPPPVQPAGDGKPISENYETWEAYYEDLADWKVNQRLKNFEPAVRTSTSNVVIDDIFNRFNVPAEGREFLVEAMSKMDAQAIASLPDEAKAFFAYGAKGWAQEKMAGKSNGAPRTEPAASAPRAGAQIADGYSSADVKLYCSITGVDPATKEGKAELRREGLIK